MGKVRLTETLRRRIALAMLVLVALMVLDGIYQAGMHVKWRRWIPETLAAERAATQPADTQPAKTQPTDTQPAETQPSDSQPAGTRPATTQTTATRPGATRPAGTQPIARKPSGRQAGRGGPKGKSKKVPAVHAAIKKRNIMAQPKPKGHGMQLTGVLGNIALFKTREGKTVGIEEGKSSSGVKVRAIKGYEVLIEFEGKTETMKLFSERKGRGRGPRGPDRSRPGGTSRRSGRSAHDDGSPPGRTPATDAPTGGRDRIAPSDSDAAGPTAATGPYASPMAKGVKP